MAGTTASGLRAGASVTAAWLLLIVPAQADKARAERVTVYCGGAFDRGFQRADIADSTRDLREALKGKKKTLVLVDDARQADVAVIVEDRGRDVVGTRVRREDWPGGGDVESTVKTLKTVRATLIAGPYEQALVGTDDIFWSLAADQLASQVDRWIKTNREHLLARRSQRDNAESAEK